MANEFIITDVVDKKAFDQLDELTKKMGEAKDEFVEITKTIGNGISMPVGSLEDYNKKMQEFNQQGEQLAKVQKEMTDLQAKYEALLQKVNKGIEERTKAIKIEASYEEQLAKLEARKADLDGEQAKKIQKLKLEISEKTKEVKRAAQAELDQKRSTDTVNKSYYEKQQILSSLGRQIKMMNTETEVEKKAQAELIRQYNQLNNELKKVDESMGNYHRNVGNYVNSIREALGIGDGFVGHIVDIIDKSGKCTDGIHNMVQVTKEFGKQTWALLKNPIVAMLAAFASAVALVSKGISSSEENTKKWNVVLAPFNKLLEKVTGWLQAAAAKVLDFALAMEKGFVKVLRFLHIFPDLADSIERSINEAEAANEVTEQTEEVTEKAVKGITKVSVTSSEAIKTAAELASEAVKALQGRYASLAVTQSALYNAQQNALAGRLATGEISGSEYDTMSAALAARYQAAQQRLVIQGLEQQLEVENLTAEERKSIYEELTKAKIKLDEMQRTASVDAIKAAEKASEEAAKAMVKANEDAAKAAEEQMKLVEQQQRERQEAVIELAQQSLQVFQSLTTFISGLFSKELDELDKNLSAQQDKYERLAESGAMSTEEAEARKRAAEEETERKREEIQKKQAAMEKAANVASTVMNTAVAIMKAWSQGGIFAAPMVALIAAQGAIQLATILATKAYAKGTDNAAGGLSIVGDGGRRELVLGANGAWITPDTPTLVNLHRGDKVLPDAEEALSNRRLMSDYGLLTEQARSEEGLTIHVDGTAEQVKEQEATNAKLEEIRRLMRKQGRDNAYRYIYARV